jgi:ankyrin repeat protein
MKFATSFFTESKIINLLNSTVKYDNEQQVLQAINETKPWQWIPFPIRKTVALNNATQIPVQFNITPLSLAAMMGHTEIIQFMLDLGADINIVNDGEKTSLHIAVINNKKESVKILLNNSNINVNARDKDLNTALHFAANGENIDIIVMLIDSNIDLHALNIKGETALAIARKNGKEQIIQLLIRQTDMLQIFKQLH